MFPYIRQLEDIIRNKKDAAGHPFLYGQYSRQRFMNDGHDWADTSPVQLS